MLAYNFSPGTYIPRKKLDPRSRICVAFQKKLASAGCMLSCLDSALTVGQWTEVAQKDSEAGSRRSRSQNFLQKGIKWAELRKGSSFSWPASCLPQWQKTEEDGLIRCFDGALEERGFVCATFLEGTDKWVRHQIFQSIFPASSTCTLYDLGKVNVFAPQFSPL